MHDSTTMHAYSCTAIARCVTFSAATSALERPTSFILHGATISLGAPDCSVEVRLEDPVGVCTCKLRHASGLGLGARLHARPVCPAIADRAPHMTTQQMIQQHAFFSTAYTHSASAQHLNRNCRLRLDTSMVSMSMTSMFPKPDSARSLSSSQPRPPAPTHSTRQSSCSQFTCGLECWPARTIAVWCLKEECSRGPNAQHPAAVLCSGTHAPSRIRMQWSTARANVLASSNQCSWLAVVCSGIG